MAIIFVCIIFNEWSSALRVSNTQEVNELISMGTEHLTVSPYNPFFSGEVLVHTDTVEKSCSVARVVAPSPTQMSSLTGTFVVCSL